MLNFFISSIVLCILYADGQVVSAANTSATGEPGSISEAVVDVDHPALYADDDGDL